MTEGTSNPIFAKSAVAILYITFVINEILIKRKITFFVKIILKIRTAFVLSQDRALKWKLKTFLKRWLKTTLYGLVWLT